MYVIISVEKRRMHAIYDPIQIHKYERKSDKMKQSSTPMTSDISFFRIAKEMSNLSDHHYKLGCVVVRGHRIISSGHNNKTKGHPIQAKLDKQFFGLDNCLKHTHAEVATLVPLIKRHEDLSDCTLYIYRQNALGQSAMARPCPRCMQLIKQQGIKKIKYSTDDGFAVEKIFET